MENNLITDNLTRNPHRLQYYTEVLISSGGA